MPLEATQNQVAWTQIGPAVKFTRIMSQSMTFDASFNRSGYWWPDYAWTDDARRPTGRPRRPAWRLPGGETRAGAVGLERDLVAVSHHWPDQPRRSSRDSSGITAPTTSRTTATPTSKGTGTAACRATPTTFSAPIGARCSNTPSNTNAGIGYNSWYANDSVNLTRKLTVNAGVRFDRYTSWLPEQGNPGTGPYAGRPGSIPRTRTSRATTRGRRDCRRCTT